MWRTIKVVWAVSVIAITVGMTIPNAFGQENTRNDVGATTTTSRDNDGFDYGWIGLAGLAGLVGLLPRDRRGNNEHDLKRNH